MPQSFREYMIFFLSFSMFTFEVMHVMIIYCVPRDLFRQTIFVTISCIPMDAVSIVNVFPSACQWILHATSVA
jgi:hypothetical protein